MWEPANRVWEPGTGVWEPARRVWELKRDVWELSSHQLPLNLTPGFTNGRPKTLVKLQVTLRTMDQKLKVTWALTTRLGVPRLDSAPCLWPINLQKMSS